MNLDIRLPIGIMFGLFGVMLTIFGIVGDPRIYARSLGVDINLWWGIVLLAFGIFMTTLGWRGSRRAKANAAAAARPSDQE